MDVGRQTPEPRFASGPLVDRLDRPLHDLRISVTDRCNFRCTYCMPKEIFGADYAFLPRAEVLSFEEIERVARVFVELGVEKLRLTGGEPLVRRDLPVLVEKLAAIRRPDGGLLDLTLTTNGSALRKLAGPLAAAGLGRVTISLDSLDDAVFGAMNGVDFPVAKVLDGVAAAQEAGLGPVKINMVVRRGINEASVLPMARWARATGVTLRFIEYMDVGHTNGWRMDDVVPADELVTLVDAEMPLLAEPPRYRGEVATRYRYADGSGEIGLIASVTRPFCGDCTRARLSAEGRFYTCLFTGDGHDLRAVLRDPAAMSAPDDAVLREAVAADRDVRDGRLRAPLAAGATPAGALRRRSGQLVHPSSTSVENSWTVHRLLGWRTWTSALTGSPARSYRRSCPKGPAGTGETEITSRTSAPRRSLRAFRCSAPTAPAAPVRVATARRTATGIPVSVRSSGPPLSGPRPFSPWTRFRRPACP
jgi:GTP 3',8-cyclase